MLDPILQKFGLSETKRFLKGNSTQRSKQKSSKTEKFIHKPTVRPFNQSDIKEDTCQTQNRLEAIIREFRNRKVSKCQKKGHQNNRIKYLCMEKDCTEKFGCSYCFLRHQQHDTVQIDNILNNLTSLNDFVAGTYSQISAKKIILEKQLISDIDAEILCLCDEFHSNLQFLKNKALRQINEYLFQKYEMYEIMCKQQQRSFRIHKLDDQSLVDQILSLNIKAIEKNLQKSLKSIDNQKFDLSILTKYFEEMNSSMGYFMAEFKKAFPKLSHSSSEILDNASEQKPLNCNTLNNQKSNNKT